MNESASTQKYSVIVIMVCVYIFLFIERPWESIRYFNNIPIERPFAIALILMAILHHKFRIVSSPTNIWVYGLLAMHFILAPFAFNTGDAIDQGIEYAKMVVLYLLMLSVADDEESLKILIKAYVFSMCFYMLHSLLEFHNGRHVYRMGIIRMVGVDSTFSDPNAFGGSIVLSLPFAYALLKTEINKWLKNVYIGYFVLAIICVVLTGSRSSFVALLLLGLLWAIAQKGARKFKIMALVIPMLFIVWGLMPTEKQDRIRTLWNPEAGPENAQSSAEGRLEGFKVSWKMFKQVPFTGVGAGGNNFVGYRIANKIDEEGHESATQAHNLYGQVLAEFGILGTLLFSGLIISIFRFCLTIRRHMSNCFYNDTFYYLMTGAIISSLVLLLFLGLGGHNFYRPLWLWLAAWSGALFNFNTKSHTTEAR